MSAENIIAICFLSRDVAHKAHLTTTSYAAHKATEGFYTGIIELADKLAEAWQGRGKVLKDIPYLAPEGDLSIIPQLESHLKMLELHRYKDLDKDDTPIQNIMDEIIGQYLSTLYMLRRLK